MIKDLLGIKEITDNDIFEILDAAQAMKNMITSGQKKSSELAGKSIVTLFYENSTRTRMSFELAGKFLSASTSNIAVAQSSVSKGETLIDTGMTLDSMLTDVIIIRHQISGSSHLLAKNVSASVINAGDGMNEHPTQCLLDLFTMREKFNTLNLKVAIVGDIKHSRVARSNILALTRLGADVRLCAPNTLLPIGIENMGGKVYENPIDAVRGADVVMGLRIQQERQHSGLFPSTAEYHKFYGINDSVLKFADKNAIIMHPGPINRGVELTSQIADCSVSKINEQVLNGVAVRMAILSLLCKNKH